MASNTTTLKCFFLTQNIKLCSFALLLAFFLSSPTAIYANFFWTEDENKDYLVSINTTFGTIYLVLFDDAPAHKENFLKLVDSGFYNGTTFHFLIEDFVILGGDKNTKAKGNSDRVGVGTPGYTLEAEISSWRKHQRGTLAAARQKNALNPMRRSSGSHFYIIQNPNGAPHLDGEYSIFGQVIYGMSVVDKIAAQAVDNNGKPLEAIPITIQAEKMKKKKITKLFGYTFSD